MRFQSSHQSPELPYLSGFQESDDCSYVTEHQWDFNTMSTAARTAWHRQAISSNSLHIARRYTPLLPLTTSHLYPPSDLTPMTALTADKPLKRLFNTPGEIIALKSYGGYVKLLTRVRFYFFHFASSLLDSSSDLRIFRLLQT